MRRTILFCSIFASILIVNSKGQDIGDLDTCRFNPSSPIWTVASNADSLFTVELWAFSDDPQVSGISLGFELSTSTGLGSGHDDSLLIVDSFAVNLADLSPGIFSTVGISYLDESLGGLGWGYNGFSLGLVSFDNGVFPAPVQTRLGNLTLKLTNAEDISDDFDIIVDSSFFPPAGAFKFSPTGGTGFPPQYYDCVIHVVRQNRTIYYVDTLGSDSLGDGSDANPYRTIQHAIDQTTDGDTVVIHDGEYFERITFDSKAITVGSEYVLDMDLTHIENTIINGDTAHTPLVSDTGSVVRFVNGEDSTSVLCGVMVTDGVGTNERGGGVYAHNSSALIVNCIIEENSAERGGGAYGGLLRYCTIQYNDAQYGAGCFNPEDIFYCDLTNNIGSGMCFSDYPFKDFDDFEPIEITGCNISGNDGFGVSFRDYLPSNADNALRDKLRSTVSHLFRDCVISNNTGRGISKVGFAGLRFEECLILENAGGVRIYGYDATATLNEFVDCVFKHNFAVKGGAAFSSYNQGSFIRTVFIGNSADFGGALYSDANADAGYPEGVLEGCTFAGNSAPEGSAIWYSHDFLWRADSCIFAFNAGSSSIYSPPGDSGIARYCSNVFGNGDDEKRASDNLPADSNGNISLDPLFCDAAGGDFTIRDVSPCAPENNECNSLIGAYGVGCTGVPSVIEIGLLGETNLQRVINHTPEVYWRFDDPVAGIQDSFEIEVGTDDSWDSTEKWNPEPFESSDTSVVYDGEPLVDGETIWLRLRTNNGHTWSEWNTISFRMNSAPGAFDLISPADTILGALNVDFFWSQSVDIDLSDSLRYSLFASADSGNEYTVWSSDLTDTFYASAGDLVWGRDYVWKVRVADLSGDSSWSNDSLFFRTALIGDVDSTRSIDVDDIIYLINHVFLNGPPPYPEVSGDVNCDGRIDIDDIVVLIAYVFNGGPEPCAEAPLAAPNSRDRSVLNIK